uniref:Uncharacterized protein n=1 Tax=Tanacetum cinerariifolium TaxID=118510 RepID=A0A6L2MBM3_TANCI|nr:hypothetical protein [Tanacetum cinerariifolium]
MIVKDIRSEDNPAVPFTKALAKSKHDEHTKSIGVRIQILFSLVRGCELLEISNYFVCQISGSNGTSVMYLSNSNGNNVLIGSVDCNVYRRIYRTLNEIVKKVANYYRDRVHIALEEEIVCVYIRKDHNQREHNPFGRAYTRRPKIGQNARLKELGHHFELVVLEFTPSAKIHAISPGTDLYLNKLSPSVGPFISSTKKQMAGLIEGGGSGSMNDREEIPPLTKEQIEGHVSTLKLVIKNHNRKNRGDPIHLDFKTEDAEVQDHNIAKGKEMAYASNELPKGETREAHRKTSLSLNGRDARPFRRTRPGESQRDAYRNSYRGRDAYRANRIRDDRAPYLPLKGEYNRRIAPVLTLNSLTKLPKGILATKT